MVAISLIVFVGIGLLSSYLHLPHAEEPKAVSKDELWVKKSK
jgi:hypothetical protein